jgi:hypothetical protein
VRYSCNFPPTSFETIEWIAERRGGRHVWGRRVDVRAVLYMAVLGATRHNPVIRAFYERPVRPLHHAVQWGRSRRSAGDLIPCSLVRFSRSALTATMPVLPDIDLAAICGDSVNG